MHPAELTASEQLVWNAFGRGTWVELGGGTPAAIRAEVIAALLLGAATAEPGSAAGVRLRGAAVTGRLDLRGGTVTWPLVCDGCRFDDELGFVDSSVRTVCLLDCDLPAFDGTRLRLDGILDLAGSAIAGGVRLEHAKVTGQLRLRGARAGAGAGAGAATGAVAATGLSVDGDVDCAGLDARGSVSFQAAAITGAVDLTGARVSCPGGRGLNLNYATIGGKLGCRELTVDGETRANNCRIAAQLTMAGARLDNPAGVAFFAGGLQVGGGAFFTSGFRANGEFRNAIGQPAQGRHVLYARERIQRQGRGLAARTWSMLQDITVGYGYRPRRALGWLALLLAAGSVVFSVTPPPVLQPGTAPRFNGIVYTLDLMLPVVNLGQKYAFNPGGAEQWLSYFFIAAGWTLATTVATGAARILRRG